jgi:hypothetical protein
MAYDPELPGCFGDKDLLFANHPSDQERAFAWLTKLRRRRALWSEAQRQIEEYLREREAPVFHILDQTERAKMLLAPWLEAEGPSFPWCEGKPRKPHPDDGLVAIPLADARRLIRLAGYLEASLAPTKEKTGRAVPEEITPEVRRRLRRLLAGCQPAND